MIKKYSGGDFGKVNFQELAKLKFLDAWLVSFFRQPYDYFKDWSIERKILHYELVNVNPSVEDIRAAYKDYMKQQDKKIVDPEIAARAKEFGIDVDELNEAIDKGEFNI